MAEALPRISFDLQSETAELPLNLRVYRFRMSEAVSEPYTMVLDAATEEVDFDFESLLGHGVQLDLLREDHIRTLFGVVSAIEWLGISGDRLQLRLTVVPAFALLAQEVHTRMFQELSVVKIVEEVLGPGLRSYDRALEVGSVSRGSKPREVCTQYRESTFDFVCRLLEEEGISYLFVHDPDAGAEKLTLIDAPDQLLSCANVDGSDLFPIVPVNPDETDLESVQAIEWRRRLTSTGTLRRDFDWKTPESLLSSEAGQPDLREHTRRVYVHGQRRFFEDDLADRASDLAAAHSLPGTRGFGRSNAVDFHPGFKFAVDGHQLEALDEELVLMRVEHSGDDPSALPALEAQHGAAGGYNNLFECVPASAELRPMPHTPKPQVRGPQTAIVVGPAGEEIHVDSHGRIQVQFHWDEEPTYQEDASCWIRVAHSWAGPAWGTQFIPRIGMEVMVEFLEGNPDRPLVTGCVYNGHNAPPFPLPDNKTQSGIRTSSTPGEGSNELRFEDAAGAEEIYLHGQRDWTIAIENDKNQTVGNDETLSVGHDRSKEVGNDESVTIGNDETITVGNDHEETIQHDMSLTVGNNQTVTVAKDHGETIGGNRSESIAQSASEKVGVTKSVQVGGALQLTVGGAINATVGGAVAQEVGGAVATVVAGAASEEIGEDKQITVGKKLAIEVNEDATIATGKTFGLSSGDAMTISSTKDMAVGSEAKAVIEASDELTLKCGSAKIVLKSSGDITIQGGKIDVKGSGPVNIKGAKVNNN